MGKGVQYLIYLYKCFISGTHFGKCLVPKMILGVRGTEYLGSDRNTSPGWPVVWNDQESMFGHRYQQY
jgi:hypothetical protein